MGKSTADSVLRASPIFRDLVLAGVLSSFLTVLCLVVVFNVSKYLSPETLPDLNGKSVSNALVGVLASATPADSSSKGSRFLVDVYPVLGPVRWEHLSPSTQADFTLNGKIHVGQWFVGKTYDDTSAPVWSSGWIDEMVKQAATRNPRVKLSTYGAETNAMFWQALEEFPVKGKSVLVVGSRAPWVEAFCIDGGAGKITTVDFNVPKIDDPRLKAISIPELDATDERFDVVVSYSSLEHDGMGRYGDPINPNGDLQRMKKLQGLIKPDGWLFLGVPNGNDSIHFNAHRIYGPIRFPMLIEGWQMLKTFGSYSLDQHYRMAPLAYRQPLHVLKLSTS